MMVWNLVAAAALAAIVTGLGWAPVRALDRGGRLSEGETAAAAFGLGATIFSLAVLAVGLVRLDGWTMWGLAALALVVAVPGWWAMPWAEWLARARRHASAADGWTRFLWIAAVAIAVSALLQGLAPPNDYDSLLYHLNLPLYDVEQGRIAYPWERDLRQIGYPALGGNLSRFFLVVAGDGAAQVVHGAFGVVAAAGAALLVRRLGFGAGIALLAAILFLAVRSVVWQMATAETDLLLAAYTILAFLVYRTWRECGGGGLAFLFGLMVGSGIYAKYIGFPVAVAFAPLMIWDLARRRLCLTDAALTVAAAVLVIAPHSVHMFVETGNPIFPLFNSIFNPVSPEWYRVEGLFIGTGLGLVDALMGPWTLFILPVHYYDGMVLGAPYLLALTPLILLAPRQLGKWGPALLIVLVFYLQWLWLLTQQVRFLTTVLPIIAAAAAAGAALMWERVRPFPFVKAAFAAVTGVLALNQAMFVGIYAAIRLPAAVGLMDIATYHTVTPTMEGAHFATCKFIRDNLKPGETYFSMTGAYLSYYCPQASAVYTYFPDEAKWWLKSAKPPAMSFEEFLRRVEEARFRYFIVSKVIATRRKTTLVAGFAPDPDLVVRHEHEKVDYSRIRNGEYVTRAIAGLEPLVEESFTAVYDGAQVLERLRAMAPAGR